MREAFRADIEIEATPDEVFDYFVEPSLLVRWMGDYAQLEAKDGGLFAVDINGVLIRGTYRRLDRPKLIEITWGEAGNDTMPPGSTWLIVRFVSIPTGTRVELEHHGLDVTETKKHAIGWPHFLERLGLAASGRDPGPDPWANDATNPSTARS